MLDLLTVARKFMRPRTILAPCARPQQQTRRPPLLLSIDRTDGRILDRFMTFTAYYADRVTIRNKNRNDHEKW